MSAETLRQGMETVSEVYQIFLEKVVKEGVLSEKERRGYKSDKIDGKRRIDTRVARLMCLSGKGGWSEILEERQDREKIHQCHFAGSSAFRCARLNGTSGLVLEPTSRNAGKPQSAFDRHGCHRFFA